MSLEGKLLPGGHLDPPTLQSGREPEQLGQMVRDKQDCSETWRRRVRSTLKGPTGLQIIPKGAEK